MHQIFREDPGIFTRTFARLNITNSTIPAIPHPVSTVLLSGDVTEIQPLERRLDSLFRFDMADGESFLLAIEAQGKKDADKHGSWAYYMAYLHAKYAKPPLLLVVCQDDSTARWAARPYHLGEPYWQTLTVRPLVLGPHNVPAITDPAAAADDIPMAAFSAMTHCKQPEADMILRALATALKTADEDTADLFKELTELGLGKSPAAKTWRNLMAIPTSFFRSETAEKLRDEGRAEGKARDILRILEFRSIEVGNIPRARIMRCTDLGILDLWFDRALAADRLEDVLRDEE
ncbi:hypothetical protein [Streptomyces sp. CA-111067]|uniref:hypothetical protein n=1 Tax=Streptomyces sp. CA-111067 TaxID=3240046 RepID=UPI003D984F30